MSKLTSQEIYKLVHSYIGVEDGYLCDFSYSTLQEFYPRYCGLNIDTLTLLDKTTRARFIYVIENATPQEQAKILEGVLLRCPPSPDNLRKTQEQANEIASWAVRCKGTVISGELSLSITSDVVERAISDAELLIRENGATSGIDRIHTALHGYLFAVCESANIVHDDESSVTTLFKLLRQNHTNLQPSGPRADEITKILRALANIVDAINPVRNKASVAHPNQDLISEDEASLVINAAKSLMHYLEKKFVQ